MNIYLRKKNRNSSGTLFVTFALGVAIGFSVAYAIFGASTEAVPGAVAPSITQAAVPPSETPLADAPPESQPETPPGEAVPEAGEAVPEAGEAVPEAGAVPAGVEGPASVKGVWPGRFLFIAAPDVIDDAAAALIAEIRPGGVVLRGPHISDPGATLQTVALIKAAAGFGRAVSDLPLIAVEQEGGDLNPLGLSPSPAAAELAITDNTETARRLGEATAQAALERGVGVVLAPVLAVLPKGVKNDAMAKRVFGSDQELVANMGLAVADGIALGGAVAVGKYYPGVGLGRKDGTRLQVLDAESPKLAELMYPFWEAATAGLPGIMAGHVAVPSLDLSEPDRPASMSPVLIRRILRDDWKYGGVILSDDVCSPDLPPTTTPANAAVDALAAGCDAVLVLASDPAVARAVCKAIEEAVRVGKLSDEELVESGQQSARKLFEQDLVESQGRLELWQTQLAGRSVSQGQPPVNPAAEPDAPAEPAPAPEPPQPEPIAVEPAPAPEPPKPEPIAAEPAPAPEPPQPEPVAAEPAPAPEPPQPEPVAAEPAPAPEPPKPEPVAVEPAPAPAADSDEPVEIVHVIQPGEILSGIAAYYHVRQADIVKWNNMKSTNIKYGYKLKIYRPMSAPPTAAETEPPAPPGPEPPEAVPPADQVMPEPAPEQPPSGDPSGAKEAAALEPEGSAEPPALLANRRKYVVEAGDTLESISRKIGIDTKIIKAWNGLGEEDVSEGQVLVIFASGADAAPAPSGDNGFYIVKEGDNAYRIAAAFDTNLATLMKMNKDIQDPNMLLVGQRIAVPKRP